MIVGLYMNIYYFISLNYKIFIMFINTVSLMNTAVKYNMTH